MISLKNSTIIPVLCFVLLNACKHPETSTSFRGAFERQLNNVENNIISTAEAMPEDKFYFTPESLHIKGSEFTQVRTFAGQIKHLAADNFILWSPVVGDSMKVDINDAEGPENIKTKADIMSFLRESFALGHRAIAAITEKNAMDILPLRGGNVARLDLAFSALVHANDHYGQMVVYARMCGIIPPPSTKK